MIKNLFLVLLSFTVLFTACNKDDVNVTKDDSDYTIDGYIVNADGNLPMKNVTIKGAFGETKSDDKGYFKVEGLKHGSYSLIFTAAGYGSMIYTYALEPDAETPLEVNYSRSVVVFMYEMNEGLETKLWKSIDNKKVEMANVPYTIELSENFLYNKITGTTDGQGKIVLSDTLPNAEVTLVLNYKNNEEGKLYKLRTTFVPNSVENYYVVSGQNIDEELFLIDANIFDTEGDVVDNFAVASDLTFSFNQDVEDYEDLHLTNVSDNHEVAVNVSVSGSTLTISPLGDLDEADRYRVSFTAKNGGNDEYIEYYFSTEGGVTSLGAVTGLARVSSEGETKIEVYETTTSVKIEFIRPEGAKTYEVYAKYGDQKEFKKAYTFSAGTDPDDLKEIKTLYSMDNSLTDMDIPTSGMFADGNTYTIVVRALNEAYDLVGGFSNELVIKKTADIPAGK